MNGLTAYPMPLYTLLYKVIIHCTWITVLEILSINVYYNIIFVRY